MKFKSSWTVEMYYKYKYESINRSLLFSSDEESEARHFFENIILDYKGELKKYSSKYETFKLNKNDYEYIRGDECGFCLCFCTEKTIEEIESFLGIEF